MNILKKKIEIPSLVRVIFVRYNCKRYESNDFFAYSWPVLLVTVVLPHDWPEQSKSIYLVRFLRFRQ